MRSYRELWLWLGAALLTVATVLAAIALAYFTKEQQFSLYTSWQMLAAAVTFLVAFICFLGAIVGWPFPPWAKLRFPDIKVDIYGAGFYSTEREVAPDFRLPATLLRYKIRITNLEKEQNASLTVRPYLKLVSGSMGRVGEMTAVPVDWAIDPSLGLDPLPEVIGLLPGATSSGDLVYEISRMYDGKIAQPRQVRLEIEDHTSGKKMERELGGDITRFSRGDMHPTLGGFRLLGPEYEPHPANSDETDSTSPGVAERETPSG